MAERRGCPFSSAPSTVPMFKRRSYPGRKMPRRIIQWPFDTWKGRTGAGPTRRNCRRLGE